MVYTELDLQCYAVPHEVLYSSDFVARLHRPKRNNFHSLPISSTLRLCEAGTHGEWLKWGPSRLQWQIF